MTAPKKKVNINRSDIKQEIYEYYVFNYPMICPNINVIDDIIKKTFEIMKRELMKNKRVELRGFGGFYVKTLKPKISKKPKTGEPIKIGERKKIKFKNGKDLKLWGGYNE